ncbi:MAG: hypothetical protein RLZZ139_2388 [Cyanobacteriota bacterium]|jgi:hypothetical protein
MDSKALFHTPISSDLSEILSLLAILYRSLEFTKAVENNPIGIASTVTIAIS